MEINFGFLIVKESNGKYGAQIVVRDAAGNQIGEPVSFIDAYHSSPDDVAHTLVSFFRGMQSNARAGTVNQFRLGPAFAAAVAAGK